MKKGIAFFLLLMFIYWEACTDCSGEKLDSSLYFSVNKIFTKNADSYQNGNQLQETTLKEIDFQHYAILLDYDLSYHANCAPKPSFSLFPTALACDPIEAGYYGTKEDLDTIIIKTIYDYDSLHLAGSSLHTLIDVQEKDYDNALTKNFVLVNQFPKFILQQKKKLNYKEGNGLAQTGLAFELLSPPTYKHKTAFEISLKFKNHPLLKDTTEAILIY
jgi:hypothetical protein